MAIEMNYLYSYIYKRARKNGAKFSWISKAINAVSEATHTEVVFDLALLIPLDEYRRGTLVSFSNTTAEGAGGCRFRISTFSRKEYWDKDIIPGDHEDVLTRLYKACELADVSITGLYNWVQHANPGDIFYGPKHKKYDVFGTALSFISRAKIIKSSKKRGRCSEDCARSIIESEPSLKTKIDFETLTPDDIQLIVRAWRHGTLHL